MEHQNLKNNSWKIGFFENAPIGKEKSAKI